MNENYRILEDFLKDSEEKSIEELIEAWSGISIHIPAFVGKIRDVVIIREMRKLPESMPINARVRRISRDYGISEEKIKKLWRKL